MQVRPSQQLSQLVKHYLFIESHTKSLKKLRLFPDGNTGIVFCFRNRLISGFNGINTVDYLPHSFIYGQLSNFKDVFCMDETYLLVIVFHPHGLNQLTGVPANKLIDQIIDLQDIFRPAVEEATYRLYACHHMQDRIKIIESFLFKICKSNLFKVQPLVHAAVDYIVNCQGLISVDQLVNYTGYNRKSIERKFMETIGISPKKFSGIIKLNVYLKRLRNHQDNKLSILAYEAGYYDYSHAFKEFKKITGISPLQYITEFNPLALNFLEFPAYKALLPFHQTAEKTILDDLQGNIADANAF